MWGLPKKDFQILLEREAKEENKASVHQPGNPMMSLMIPDSLAAELSSHTHLKKKERERKKKIIRRHLPRPSQTSSGTRWVPTMHASYLLRYAEFITHWMTSTTKSAVFGLTSKAPLLKTGFLSAMGKLKRGPGNNAASSWRSSRMPGSHSGSRNGYYRRDSHMDIIGETATWPERT